ncbi:hypothetical protein [Leptospira idonii]|uniref:hypothetical protein n=1 Tax=Leptospira idonii TaxID=1193500 RepID=UPI0014384999|nr:hypothetical protein [Leptospira idonii]
MHKHSSSFPSSFANGSSSDAWVMNMYQSTENLLKQNNTNKQAYTFNVRCVSTGP